MIDRPWSQGALAGAVAALIVGIVGIVIVGVSSGWQGVGPLSEWAGAVGTVAAVLIAASEVRSTLQGRREDRELEEQRRRDEVARQDRLRLEEAVERLSEASNERARLFQKLAEDPASVDLRETGGKVEKLTGEVRRRASCLEEAAADKVRRACDLIDDLWIAALLRGADRDDPKPFEYWDALTLALALRPINEAVYGAFSATPDRPYGRVNTFVDEGLRGAAALEAVKALIDEP